MEKLTEYIVPVLLWFGVAAYMVCAAGISRGRLAEATVSGIEVKIVDSTSSRRLVTEAMVREWIARSGVTATGIPAAEVDCAAIERTVAANGFVGGVAAYASADGVLRIEVSQRSPMVRFLVDGYNRYVTADGYVFGTPASSAMYVPVITGSYVPPFPSGYEGSVRTHIDSLIDGHNGLQADVRALKKQRSDILKERSKIYERRNDLNRDRPRRRMLENKSSWESRREREMGYWNNERQMKLDSVKMNERETARIDAQLDAAIGSIKKTEKNYEDFVKLLNFVERIEDDGFWRSEIVQIVAERSSAGVLTLSLIPRSGSFTIEFGAIADTDAKLERLMRFYREGLGSVGWDAFSSISVAYDGQVVCRK